jgi:3-hydroxyisobutyrate dehydrogenase
VVTQPEQAMAKADCVILMLADAAAIRAVLLTPTSLAILRGKIVIQMGTIAQEESMALQAEIERVGGSYAKHRYWEALPKHKPGHSLSWSVGPKNSLSKGVRCSVR